MYPAGHTFAFPGTDAAIPYVHIDEHVDCSTPRPPALPVREPMPPKERPLLQRLWADMKAAALMSPPKPPPIPEPPILPESIQKPVFGHYQAWLVVFYDTH